MSDVSTPPAPALVPARPTHLATDLRLACLRIARRNRFESEVAVPPHQFGILAHIARGPVTAGELCDLERVSPPTMSRAITALVEAGWVTRAEDPGDGRRVILTLTDAGHAVVDETRQAREEWMAQRLERLGADDLARLEAALPVLERIATS
jgi:DNA-binding MarR family transcriptional regulator